LSANLAQRLTIKTGAVSMYSIMIIEDDPSYCSMMELILKMEGFDVSIAPDGQSGLALARE